MCPAPCIRYFTMSQVAIAREVQAFSCRISAGTTPPGNWRSRFQIGETSLKNYFRGVFGENLSAYRREARMVQASQLLRDTDLRVAKSPPRWL